MSEPQFPPELLELVDEAPCGLLSSLPDGPIRAVNQTLLRMTGYSRDELVGKLGMSELLTVPSRMYFETHYAPLLRMQGFISEIAAEMRCRDGRTVPVFLASRERRNERGEATLVLTSILDATERRRYERELLLARRTAEQGLQAKVNFLAMFAHEVRNPLSAIIIQAHLFERKPHLPEQVVPLKRLRNSLDRVLTLINNILDISRVDAGKATLLPTVFAPKDLLQTVVHTLSPVAEEKRLPLTIEVDAALPEQLRGDAVKLDQALTNLLGNALKFTERGSVTVGAKLLRRAQDAATVQFYVADTGIGIAEPEQALLFDEYAQANPGIARKFGGTGLGLAITRRLVELHGGQLSLRSEPGRGSTFFFTVSLDLPTAAVAS